MVTPVWNNAQRVNHQNFAKKTHPCAKKNMVPRAVLMKSGLVSVNTVKQVNVAHTKTTVNAARPMSYLSKKAHLTIKRPIHKNTTFKNSNFNQRVNTVKDKNVNTVRPKAVVNAVKGNNVNAVKASTCWVWKPKTKVLDHGNPQMDLQDQGVIDSRCLRHTIRNMSYLTDYEEIYRGYCDKCTGRSQDDGSKPSSDDGKKVDEDSRKDSEGIDQEKEDNVNSTNNVNAASTNEVNAVGGKTSIKLSLDLNMPKLEDYIIFEDDEDVGAEADMHNLNITIQVSPILTIRIHKDHPLNQVIGDLKNPKRKIEEEVYVCQPPGFEDPDFPDRVYKVEKALYGLHQALRAWYETLSTYLLNNEFQRGKIDKTLFIKRYKGDILLVQVYVDDTIFGSTKKELCNAFKKLMHEKF
ncbi:putative ribonuclease H-like domain-containing protein [Tanacetum coccineum]